MERDSYIKQRLTYFRERVIEINALMQCLSDETSKGYYKDEREWYKFLISELEYILNIKE